MFGGVGLPSAKGTGTNGYVERALGYLPKDYKPGSYGEIIRQMKANPAPIKRKINDDIILHEEKHKIEVELATGLEIVFNKSGEFLRYDD